MREIDRRRCGCRALEEFRAADDLHLGRLRRPPRGRPRPARAWSRPTTSGSRAQLVDVADRHAQGRIVSCLEGGYDAERAGAQRRRAPARAGRRWSEPRGRRWRASVRPQDVRPPLLGVAARAPRRADRAGGAGAAAWRLAWAAGARCCAGAERRGRLDLVRPSASSTACCSRCWRCCWRSLARWLLRRAGADARCSGSRCRC
ncbi:MAG: hypothetical protein MZW92_42110 [Comamonadaceae bacterium]|nr:hypothetical protein [Comamonadaceae bacterium]